MKTIVFLALSLLAGVASGQVVPESSWESTNATVAAIKTVWLSVEVDDNAHGRDMNENDIWAIAAKELRAKGFTVEHQSKQAPFHFPSLTIEHHRLGSLRVGFQWWGSWYLHMRLNAVVKLSSGKFVPWRLYENNNFGYAILDQSSDELLKQQTTFIEELGKMRISP